tara:strand:+ start:878 stop:1288 length:411 start_codon:yes stop_codon:yes gene_type:complete
MFHLDTKIKLEQNEDMRKTVRKPFRNTETVNRLGSGQMRFKRRLDLPMWHQDHLLKVSRILIEAGKRIEKISNESALRNVDKCLTAQTVLKLANIDASRLTPLDPRERGSELGEYTDRGWVNKAGHAELNARDDLD